MLSGGTALLELVSRVAQLRPEDAMFDAMLRAWRAQQELRGMRDETAGDRARLIRHFCEFTVSTRGAGRPLISMSDRRCRSSRRRSIA